MDTAATPGSGRQLSATGWNGAAVVATHQWVSATLPGEAQRRPVFLKVLPLLGAEHCLCHADAAPGPEACSVCGGSPATGTTKLFMCARCLKGGPRYCSQECQKADWKAHKAACGADSRN